MSNSWHHIIEGDLDLPEVGEQVLFAEYSPEYGFYKFLGHITKDNMVSYPYRDMINISDVNLFWYELPEDPAV